MTSMDNIDLIDKKSCRVVVHRARNLKPRGKDSKSSPFVTICLGKEKFATSVIEKSQNPEWNEDCELIVRPRDSKLELTVLHQDFFLERFLGKVEIPLMEVEAAPKRSIRGWYKLLGKGSKTKKEDKNRGEIEITAQMKGDSNRSILPTAINVKSFARLNVHPLRKATSTPYIASHEDTSTNPFAETPDDDNLERVSAPQDIPKPPRGENEPQKSPMSRLSASSPQKEQSPTFQRQGMGRKIVRTSIRKDKEKPKEVEMAMRKVEQTAMKRVEQQSGDSSPRPILRTLSEECLSKSAEKLLEEDAKAANQPAKRIFYKPTSKSARRSKATSQYYIRDTPSPTHTPPASLPSSPTHTLDDDQPPFPPSTPEGEDTADGIVFAAHPLQSLSKEELIKKITDLENEVKDKDKQLTLQERYIDELLLKVITVSPGLLDQGFQPKPSIKARSPVQRYQAKKQEVVI
ncbi:uncharacterized protein [Apostichopus japonicus]|uniref:uncharacterized protein isoform X2 n=1 Tax=Stichopus japonicus TaxID=307972 RepID=UPI003AB609FB